MKYSQRKKVIDLGIERKNMEINELKKEFKCMSELHNVKAITVDMLKKMLHEMDTVQSQTLADHTRKIGKLKFSISMKSKKKKELEELSERIQKRIEGDSHKSRDRQVELETKSVFL